VLCPKFKIISLGPRCSFSFSLAVYVTSFPPNLQLPPFCFVLLRQMSFCVSPPMLRIQVPPQVAFSCLYSSSSESVIPVEPKRTLRSRLMKTYAQFSLFLFSVGHFLSLSRIYSSNPPRFPPYIVSLCHVYTLAFL